MPICVNEMTEIGRECLISCCWHNNRNRWLWFSFSNSKLVWRCIMIEHSLCVLSLSPFKSDWLIVSWNLHCNSKKEHDITAALIVCNFRGKEKLHRKLNLMEKMILMPLLIWHEKVNNNSGKTGIIFQYDCAIATSRSGPATFVAMDKILFLRTSFQSIFFRFCKGKIYRFYVFTMYYYH